NILFLSSCSSDSVNEVMPNDSQPDSQNDNPNDDDTANDPEVDGFNIQFSTDDFWEFYWSEEIVTSAQGDISTSTDNGRFRITLNESMMIQGIESYALNISGDNLEGYPGPRWKYLASKENVLFGSIDGVSLDTIFDAQDGVWKGGGFFANFDEEATINASNTTIENEFIETDAIAASYREGQTICEVINGERICANDEAFTIKVNDFFKAGIGPVGYNLSRNVLDQGGGFTTTFESRLEIGLAATSLSADDGFVPTLPPWVEKTSLPLPYLMTAVAPWDGKIYFFGGLDIDSNNSNQIYTYDPESDVWEEIGQTPAELTYQIRDGFSIFNLNYEAFVINNKIYIVRTVGPQANAILIYDPSNNSWESGPELDSNVVGVQCYIANIGETILFFPNRANRSGEVWVLNTTTNLWSSGTTNSSPHLSRSTVSSFGDKVYFSGAFRSSTRTFETRVRVYDNSVPTGQDGAWTETFFTGDGRASAESQVVNGRLYVIGGDNFGPVKRSVEEYVISQDSWKTVGSMLKARSAFLSVVVNEKIYAIDLGPQDEYSIEEYDPTRDRRSQ
ncbi:MAG: kelch repeat-containing protein, partial [Bacteroidota bacterium]